MDNFKFHIVKMTMLKSQKNLNLFYEIKSRKLLGYSFKSEPVDLHLMLEIMKNYIPPTFESIGNYQIKFNGKALYEIVNSYTMTNEYKVIQQALNFK